MKSTRFAKSYLERIERREVSRYVHQVATCRHRAPGVRGEGRDGALEERKSARAVLVVEEQGEPPGIGLSMG